MKSSLARKEVITGGERGGGSIETRKMKPNGSGIERSFGCPKGWGGGECGWYPKKTK